MKKRKLLVLLLAVLMTAFFNAAALADELTDKQNQYDKIQDKIDSINDQKDSLEDEIAADQKKVKAIEDSIDSVNKDITDMQVKISGVQKNIDVTTKELNQAVTEYNRQDDSMKKRINALYKNGTTIGYLQVVLEATSFSDFITRADVMKKVVDYDIKMLREMKSKRDEINKKKTSLEQDKAELVALKSNLDTKKKQFESQKQERKTMIALLSRKVQTLNSALQQEEAAAKSLLKEISALQSNKGNYDGSKYAILHKSDFPSGKQPRITSGFGYRIDPITGKKDAYHSGIDIGTASTTNIPVYAMSSGKVILAKWYGGYGNAVIIDHGGGFSTLYGHNNKLLVSEGQTVVGGQKIALSGSTGRSTGPHVHFGAIKNGQYIDPTPYLLIGN